MAEQRQARSGRKSDYRAATFRLPPDVLDELDAHSARTGTVKGFIVEQALRAYFAARTGVDRQSAECTDSGSKQEG